MKESEEIYCGKCEAFHRNHGRRKGASGCVVSTTSFRYKLIELVWANVKGQVGRQYTTDMTFKDVKDHLPKAFKDFSSHTV